MRTMQFFLVIVLSCFSIAEVSPAGTIGPSAVWLPPQDFITKAHSACDKSNPPNYGQCFIDQMNNSGAPAAAVAFSLSLFRESDGQVGIMTEFHAVGPVDVVRVLYPLRANDNYGLLLVNGDPPILDVDDLKKLDQAAMEQNPLFQAVKQRYSGTMLFPGDRSNTMWPQVKPLPDGGQQFIIGYPLLNGCHACAHVGLARFSWDFNAKGKFLGTTYIPTPPPPKLMRPNRVPQTPPAQPPPPSQPPPQQQQP